MEYRIEKDTLGEVKVPKNSLWGAQTQRSLNNFKIGEERMPRALIDALVRIKLAAARVNARLLPEKMTESKLISIERGAAKILSGEYYSEFPLSIWQTGSGTQTNMNVNEVISHIALEDGVNLHPNDDVNMSQSSNDVFPTAMHVAAVYEVNTRLLPALSELIDAFFKLEEENRGIVKSGRTHLEDATPISFSQEISGWRASLIRDKEQIERALISVCELAIGGTAVGTGLNAPFGFGDAVAKELSDMLGASFTSADNKFHALTSKDELVFLHGALKALAADLWKIANDIRWLASGPRLGLGEITIPENEPGSSIMPGKVNPTQCEAVTMVAVQVMGNDVAVGMAASQGNFELNVFMPVCIYNVLQSISILSDAMSSFTRNCVVGIVANKDKMYSNLHNSLMLATVLSPKIGYEKTARVVKWAHENGESLKVAALTLGYLTEEEFDSIFHPEEMI